MAEVLLNPIALKSNATASTRARRIYYGKSEWKSKVEIRGKLQLIKSTDSTLESSSAITGKSVKVVKSLGGVSGKSTIPKATARQIKYVKTSLVSKGAAKSSIHKYKTASAFIRADSSLEAFVYDRDIREDMLGYLPPYYRDIKDIHSLIVSEANEFTMLYAKLDELLNQFFIDTATYSLEDWESVTNTKTKTRKLEDRRTAVKRKLGGLGTVTTNVLKETVGRFFKAEIDEIPEPGVIEIKRVDLRGKYEDLEEVREVVEEIIPRHLSPHFKFSFLPWKELDMIRRPWSEVSELTFNDISNMKWRDIEGTGIRWKQLEQLTFKQIEESYDLNRIGGTT